jgi:hypothetical protein
MGAFERKNEAFFVRLRLVFEFVVELRTKKQTKIGQKRAVFSRTVSRLNKSNNLIVRPR